jgi:hypothetical protein
VLHGRRGCTVGHRQVAVHGGGKKRTNLVVEFTVDLENWGSASASIDIVVNLSSERRGGERCIVLADVSMEML